MVKVFINLDGNEIKDLLIFKKTLFCKLSLPLTNIGREFHSYMLPDLKMYFTEEEIKNSYLFERNEPNVLLKNTNNLGKKYIITFASKTNVKKFEKYGFVVIGKGKHKIFGNEYCMRKTLD